jgi:hypothetical protein
MKSGSVLLLGGLLAAATASAQGDFPFDEIPGLDAEPSVQIDLNPLLMGFFTEAAKGAQGEAAAALEGITNVRVRVYEGISSEIGDVMRFVDDTTTRLERDGWHAVVRVNENGERVRMYMRPGTNGTISGLTVMVVDSGAGDEAVFINIAGAIEPARLGRIAAAFGMDGMFDMLPAIAAQDAGAQKRPQPVRQAPQQ